jgi:hypothetical protein
MASDLVVLNFNDNKEMTMTMTAKNRIIALHVLRVLVVVIFVGILGGCGQKPVPVADTPIPPEPQKREAESVQEKPSDTPEPTPTLLPPTETSVPLPFTDTPTPEPTAAPEILLSGLSADPQRIEFQAEDGKNLVGYYYPSKFADFPVIILMHWAVGNQLDWCVIAPWLQNRLDEEPAEIPGCADAPESIFINIQTPWWDPTWFPSVPEAASFAVFTFDFRDFGESQAWRTSSGDWAKDAQAAFETASKLEGVDPTRMVSMGASIGSDGAPDGCYLFNQAVGGGCLGAFSLSPGSYLDMDYAEVIENLDSSDPPVPVWCLAAEFDGPSPVTCTGASGNEYRVLIYEGRDEHGMIMVDPDFDPNPLDLFLEFLSLFFNM